MVIGKIENAILIYPGMQRSQQGVCHPPFLLAKIGFSDLRMKKEELSSGKSGGECRYDLLVVP